MNVTMMEVLAMCWFFFMMWFAGSDTTNSSIMRWMWRDNKKGKQ